MLALKVVVMFVVLLGSVTCQNSMTPTGTTEASQTEQGQFVRPLDTAASPVYTMTNYFLETVLRPPEIVALHAKVNLTDFEGLVQSLESDWQLWLRHYYGYLICVVLAAVYVLFLWFGGCGICCCRARGRCGGKQSPHDGKYTKPKRRTCAIFLGIIVIGLLFGVTAMFLSNFLTFEQTEQDGVPKVLGDSVRRFDNFKNLAQETYKSYFDMSFSPGVQELQGTLRNIPKSCLEEVSRQSGVAPLVATLSEYVRKINSTAAALLQVDEMVSVVRSNISNLQNNVNILKSNISRDLTSCAGSNINCATILALAANLTVKDNFTGLQNLTIIGIQIETALKRSDSNIYLGMEAAQNELNIVEVAVRNSSDDTFVSIMEQVRHAYNESKTFLDLALDFMDSVPLQKAQTYVNETVNPNIKKYGEYRYYAGIALSTYVLLVTALCSFGLLFGACGGRAGDVNNSCNKGTSSKMIAFALGLVFVLSWIIMLLTTVLLLVGGIAHNDVCRNLQNPPNAQTTDILDGIITKNFNLNFSMVEFYSTCKRDRALYTALRLDRMSDLNLTLVMDPDKYEVKSKISELNSASYNITNLTILNDVLNSSLNYLSEKTREINLQDHLEALKIPIISYDLKSFADTFRAGAGGSDAVSVLFQFYANRVTELHQHTFLATQNAVNNLANTVNVIKVFMDDFNITQTATDLAIAQYLINPSAISTAMETVSGSFYDEFTSLLADTESAIRYSLARCETVSSIVSDTLDGTCMKFLYPFNAFWFSMGWCLFFFVILIPVGIILSDFYKKTEPYMGIISTMDDDPADYHNSAQSSESGIREERRTNDRRPQASVSPYSAGASTYPDLIETSFQQPRTQPPSYNQAGLYNYGYDGSSDPVDTTWSSRDW